MTPEQQTRFKELYEEMYLICGGLDPFSYARAREIYMAAELNHKVADNYSGEDGLDENGKPVEYKSTINEKIQGTYNGISVHNTWEEQMKYLKEYKICKYENHYFARFENGKIAEMWVLNCDDVLNILLPKIKSQFDQGTSHNKDPRIGATIGRNDIIKYGERIR